MLWPDINVTIDEPLGVVSLSCDGSVAVAGNHNGTAVYASSISGDLLWSDLNYTDYISHRVKVSCGGEVAATGGIEPLSLHYYSIKPQVTIVGGEAEIYPPGSNPAILAALPLLAAVTTYLIARRRRANT